MNNKRWKKNVNRGEVCFYNKANRFHSRRALPDVFKQNRIHPSIDNFLLGYGYTSISYSY